MIIGIDLGTTNSTVAYLDGEEVRLFSLPQITARGSEEAKPSLPSFLFLPPEAEEKKCALSWDKSRSFAVGEWARDRGAELPGRVVSSAKSWLCHSGIDRRAFGLPVEADDAQRTPLEACAAYLQHIKEAWETEKGKEVPFAEQTVLITVPASFDPSARQMVEEAATAAGYPAIVLLEEPQAAFYSWLDRNEQWREQLAVGDTVLVVDVGGGTSDFSLIAVEEEEGDLTLNRIAVGQHLLLGGDNMDLALAHLAKKKLAGEGHTLDRWQMQSLVHATRAAKEELLLEGGPDSCKLTVAGRGSGLMASSLTTELTREEVESLLVDGFLPVVEADEQVKAVEQAGLQTVSLPYASDPRLTAQLANFLASAGKEAPVEPTAVLFNGGAMKAAALQKRLVEQLNQWGSKEVVVLQGGDLDFAVSRGAVVYGRARDGDAIRIRGGVAHSFFIGVEEAAPAVPGIEPDLYALCLAPFGMEEGTSAALSDREFVLTVGQPVKFRFFMRQEPSEEIAGSMVLDWKASLVELPPVETVLTAQGDSQTVRVTLEARVNELGTLELWCVAQEGERWKLDFDLRAQELVSSPEA